MTGRLTQPPLVAASAGGAATGVVGDVQAVYIRDFTPSNDESQIALGTESGIYLKDGSGSHPRPLIENLPAPVRSLEFASSGKLLYYVLEDRKAYKILSTGGAPSIVRSASTDCLSPSPDGTRIAFSGERGTERGVFVTKLDGTAVVKLVDLAETQAATRVQWVGNNRVVFDVNPEGMLYAQTIGSTPETISAGYYQFAAPSVSPNGRWMYVASKTTPEVLAFRTLSDGSWLAPIPTGVQGEPGASLCSSVGEGMFSYNPNISNQPSLRLYDAPTSKLATTLLTTVSSLKVHAWQPRVDVNVVGAGSGGVASVAVALFGSLGAKMGHMALIDFATRSSARLTTEVSAGSPYAVFRAEGDRISYFATTVDRGYTPVKFLGANVNYNGVLVSFESGVPTSALFYKVGPSAPRPRVTLQNGELQFKGDFGAVFDGAGTKLAERASAVTISEGRGVQPSVK